ncbi:MAG: quinone oxidoreductase [Acidimicrobiales bacterium]|nr:quinone oxidoreductase [Acidimicrobiales bacterium]
MTSSIAASAVVLDETGGPDVMSLRPVEIGPPGAGELLVEVHAAGVNFIDTYNRSGLYPVALPFTPGSEGSGTILEVGDAMGDAMGDAAGDPAFAVGDRVAWVGGGRSYATDTVIPAASAFPIPEGMDLDIAAALPLQGLTAHYLIDAVYPLGPSDTCLVHAAAGGTGRLIVQMAKLRGATVIATVGSEAKAELAHSAGADHVIDYRAHPPTDGLVRAVEAIVGPTAVDVVYDGVGAATFDAGIALLRTRGTMATFGNASGPVEPITPLTLMPKSLILTRPRLFDFIAAPAERERRWSETLAWVRDGALDVHIGMRAPLDEAADVHRALESRATTGKLLLLAASGPEGAQG